MSVRHAHAWRGRECGRGRPVEAGDASICMTVALYIRKVKIENAEWSGVRK